jgi:hemerythrin-like metal-binding protein
VHRLEWNADRNAVAVPEMDEQHQAIFELGNSLYRALRGGALLSAVEPGIRELVAQTRGDFAREERMMRSKRYPAYAWHKGQHDTVRARLAEVEKSLANGNREVVLAAWDYLTAWLQTHMAVSDRMMGAFLRTQEVSRTYCRSMAATLRTGK